MVLVGGHNIQHKGSCGIVASQHIFAVHHLHICLRVASVVCADVYGIFLSRLQVCQLCGYLYLAIQLQHIVGGNIVYDRSRPCSRNRSVAVYIGIIESHIVNVFGALPVYGEVLFLPFVYHIGNLCLRVQGDLVVHNLHHLLVCPAFIRQLINDHILQAFPAFCQCPGALAALCIPVIELLVLRVQILSVRIPVPGNQVLFISRIAVVAAGGRAGGYGYAVHLDGPAPELCQITVIVGIPAYHNLCVILRVLGISQGDLHLRRPRSCGHVDGFAVRPVHDLVMLQILGDQVVAEHHLDVILIVGTSLPAFEIRHIQSAQQRHLRRAAVGRVIRDPGILLVVPEESHHFTVFTLCLIAAVCQVGRPVLQGRVVLLGGAPLRCHTPSKAIDLAGEHSGFPGILGS